jgi:hypothetical protein
MKKLLSAALLLALALPAVADTQKPADVKSTVIPFTLLKSGHMAVKVKINGKGPYTLIFDTGAPINLLNNKIAKEAGLLKGMKKPLFSLFGSMGDVKVKEIEIGGLKAKGIAAIVMDHPTVGAISRAFQATVGPIDGIVGFPFFARFKMTINYKDKTLTFVPNGYNPPDVMQAMQAALMSSLGGQDNAVVLSAPTMWGLTVDKKKGDDEAGVTVTRLLPGGPAARAGLKEGDRLLTLDGRWTDSVADAYHAAAHAKAGKPVPAVVKRDGKEVTVQVTPVPGL